MSLLPPLRTVAFRPFLRLLSWRAPQHSWDIGLPTVRTILFCCFTRCDFKVTATVHCLPQCRHVLIFLVTFPVAPLCCLPGNASFTLCSWKMFLQFLCIQARMSSPQGLRWVVPTAAHQSWTSSARIPPTPPPTLLGWRLTLPACSFPPGNGG